MVDLIKYLGKRLIYIEIGACALAIIQLSNEHEFLPNFAYLFVTNPKPAQQFIVNFIFDNIFIGILLSLDWNKINQSGWGIKKIPEQTRYEITLASQLTALRDFLLVSIFFIGFTIFMIVQMQGDSLLFYMLLISLIIVALPSPLIHLQYYRLNRHMAISINVVDKTIAFTVNGITELVAFDNFKSIKIVFHESSYSTWSSYQYTLLGTDSGKNYIITSLLIKRQQEIFKHLGLKFSIERRTFPFVREEELHSLAAT
jgi:hypothetical protein